MSTVVLACRGCCCGTTKHPDVDHDAQLDAIQAAVGHRLTVTSCLGPCRWSNVIVAVDADTGQQTWFGRVLDPADTEAVAAWLAEPEAAPRPEHLVRHPPRPDRQRALQIARYARRATRA